MSEERSNGDPVNYGDFISFKTSVESRLAVLETEQKWIKESLGDLKEKIEDMDREIEETNKTIMSKIDELKSIFQIKSQGRWKEFLALVGSIVGSVLLATYLAWVLRVVIGA